MLRRRLRTVLNKPYQCGTLHKMLAEMTTHLMIVVTNYDTLLEEAFRAAGKPFDLIVYPAERAAYGNSLLWWPNGQKEPVPIEAKELDLDFEHTTVIYKMHGTVWPDGEQWDNFVITEEDYIEFLSRMTTNTSSAVPAQFYQYSRNRSFLFLGYGLRDWNLRVVLRNLRRQFEGPGAADQTGRKRRALMGDSAQSVAARAMPLGTPQRENLRHGHQRLRDEAVGVESSWLNPPPRTSVRMSDCSHSRSAIGRIFSDASASSASSPRTSSRRR